MSVTEIRARFRRSVQPQPYESVEGEVGFVEHTEEGQILADNDIGAMAEHLLTTAKAVVYRTLGLEVALPTPRPDIIQAVDEGEAKKVAPDGLGGVGGYGSVASENPPVEPTPEEMKVITADSAEPQTSVKRKRRTKAEMEEVRAAEAEAKKVADDAADQQAVDDAANLSTIVGGAEDIPGDDVPPDTEPADIPGEETPGDDSAPPDADPASDASPAEDVMSKIDFHQMVNETAVDVGIAPVKDILKKWGVIRSGDIKEGDRAEIKAEMDALIIAKKKKV